MGDPYYGEDEDYGPDYPSFEARFAEDYEGESMSKPERKRFVCNVQPSDSISMVGPDEDGDLAVEIDVTEDAVSWSLETVIEVRDYLNRFIAKAEK